MEPLKGEIVLRVYLHHSLYYGIGKLTEGGMSLGRSAFWEMKLMNNLYLKSCIKERSESIIKTRSSDLTKIECIKPDWMEWLGRDDFDFFLLPCYIFSKSNNINKQILGHLQLGINTNFGRQTDKKKKEIF